jgi:hypothetical protein
MDTRELELFINESPEGAVTLVNMDEDPENDIYKLNDHILVRERIWKSDPM